MDQDRIYEHAGTAQTECVDAKSRPWTSSHREAEDTCMRHMRTSSGPMLQGTRINNLRTRPTSPPDVSPSPRTDD